MADGNPIAAPRKLQPTLYDVSRLSGVSSATVSRVFSSKAKVSDEVRERVLNAAKRVSAEMSHTWRGAI